MGNVTRPRALMTASAVYLLGSGLALNFMAEEVAAWAMLGDDPAVLVLLQVVAGLHLGMGITSWMWRRHPFGGIYGRPVGLGNMTQFTVVAFALGRAAADGRLPQAAWLVVGLYALFALAFGWAVFFGGEPDARAGA